MNAQRHLASPVDEPVAAVANGVRFGILGPLEARICGEQVELGPPKQRALLAVLISHANETVSRERLIDALWPEAPPTNARHSVHVYISRLRRAFGEHAASIETRLGGYQLQIDDGALDLHRFRAMVDEGRAALARDPVH